MSRWYQRAERCYVDLSDVSKDVSKPHPSPLKLDFGNSITFAYYQFILLLYFFLIFQDEREVPNFCQLVRIIAVVWKYGKITVLYEALRAV
jgi:hypothetical protein